MSTHNICFHEEIGKYRYFSFEIVLYLELCTDKIFTPYRFMVPIPKIENIHLTTWRCFFIKSAGRTANSADPDQTAP